MKRVCGLDVHKDSIFCCISDKNGVVFQEKFGVLTSELLRLVSFLQEFYTSEVAMESTSIYWIPIWRIFDLNKEIVRKLTKLDACLQRCNIRISNFLKSSKYGLDY